MSSLDAMLVNLTLQGDQSAFARLMERHRPGLLNLALSQVGNLSEAEDLVQEAFIQAYQHLKTLQEPEKFPGWIYRITRNLCYAVLRKQTKRADVALENALSAVDASTPETFIEGRELSESIVKAVATLPENNKRIFLLYLEGWSYRNIATTLDLSTSTVSGRLQLAKQQLKNSLSKDGLFAASPGPTHIERGYLREEIYKMSEGIPKPSLLRRRIYGLGHCYGVKSDFPVLMLDQQRTIMYLFREIISGRMYPDVFLENGARMYQPGAQRQEDAEQQPSPSKSASHTMPAQTREAAEEQSSPEPFIKFSTPECDSLKVMIAYQKAGERILERLSEDARRKMKADGLTGEHLWIYQGEPQERGGAASAQENYLMDAKVTDDQ